MEKTDLYQYFWLGTCVRYLQDIQAGSPIAGDDFVIGNIDKFLELLDDFGMVVTVRTSALDKLKDLRQILAEVKTDEHAKLSQQQANSLHRIMQEIRATLEAEIQGGLVFIVSPKRIDVNKLLDDIPNLFSPNTFGELPDIAKYDFAEAGRCIAFERPTAAAFHMLRGTEAVLRHFYCQRIRQNRVSPLLWGPMVTDLRQRPKTRDHQTLYNNLDNIRVSYRNPTQHPEAMYDIHEAQDLWGLCVEVVNRMMKILNAA